MRLRYSHLALYSHDPSYQRIDFVIITQVVLHLSIICATVPCAKPFLAVFHSGNLRVSIDSPVPLLPIARRPVAVDGKQPSRGSRPVDEPVHGLRKRTHWRIVLRPEHTSTVTTIRHDPIDAKEAARRRSMDSSLSSKQAITRTDSFRVYFEHGGGLLSRQKHKHASAELENWRLPAF